MRNLNELVSILESEDTENIIYEEGKLLGEYIRALEECVARLHPDGVVFGVDVRMRVEDGTFGTIYADWLANRPADADTTSLCQDLPSGRE